jgi:hypothetical protein
MLLRFAARAAPQGQPPSKTSKKAGFCRSNFTVDYFCLRVLCSFRFHTRLNLFTGKKLPIGN